MVTSVRLTFERLSAPALVSLPRVGNLFAITVAFCLKIAIANAYWQCLKLKLKQQHVSLATLDDAFGAVGSIFSLANKELFSTLQLAASLALILW